MVCVLFLQIKLTGFEFAQYLTEEGLITVDTSSLEEDYPPVFMVSTTSSSSSAEWVMNMPGCMVCVRSCPDVHKARLVLVIVPVWDE